tara:strand:+ start:4330 stop:5220 length:891 start_codon:yes stop_codon:yes gene_type:complete
MTAIIKKDNLTKIKNYLTESATLKETLGQGQEKYINSVIFEIMKTQGDAKKDLTVCTPKSIATSIKQACDLELEIDARQHCHLIKYGNEANLQIGYRGFVYSIKRAFADANIDVQLVYKGDDFKLSKEGDVTTYTLTRNNPFAPKTDVIGGFCYISYSINGRLVSFCETVSLEEINKIKGCAKQQFIWNQWFEEKAKVAIIRRACKIHFAGISSGIEKMAEFDNQNFDLDKKEMKEVKSDEPITQEQALELEELIKKAGKDSKTICKIHDVHSLLQFPESELEDLKKTLEAQSDNS